MKVLNILQKIEIMKRSNILFIILLMLLTTSCTNAKSNKDPEGEVVMLNKADFLEKVFNYEKQSAEWLYEGEKPCIIDFYADWCGPCKIIEPFIKELAAQYKDEVVFYRIDVDEESELAAAFGISNIPLLLFVPMEGPPKVSLGAIPKATLEEQLKIVLLGMEL